MPFYESCSMFFNLLTGIMLIGEGELYTNGQLACVFVGNIVCISGIFLKMSTLEAYEPQTAPVEEEEEDQGDFVHRRQESKLQQFQRRADTLQKQLFEP